MSRAGFGSSQRLRSLDRKRGLTESGRKTGGRSSVLQTGRPALPHLLHLVSQKESEDTPYRPALVAQGLRVPSAHSQGEKQRWAWSVEMGALVEAVHSSLHGAQERLS